MPSPATTNALLTAVAPLVAYCARTPAGNYHADQCASLIDAIADYVAQVEPEAPGPDWESITYRMAAYIDTTEHAPNAVILRATAHLATLNARAGLTPAQRLYLSSITSHHLHVPDCF